jgi:hypothetical protein
MPFVDLEGATCASSISPPRRLVPLESALLARIAAPYIGHTLMSSASQMSICLIRQARR